MTQRHARNAYGTHERRITPHAVHLSLGADDVTRPDAYRRLLASMDANDIDALRLHTQQQKPWGSERPQFVVWALCPPLRHIRRRAECSRPSNGRGTDCYHCSSIKMVGIKPTLRS
jgi:putative transposase